MAAGLADVSQARNDYSMANRRGAQKRRVRGVPSQGAGADYHYRSEADWLWMSELAWDLYRNDMIMGSIVDRAIENTVQDGFGYHPMTGDRVVDAELVDWWSEVSINPWECDPANELVFEDQVEFSLRSTLVAGDIMGVPMAPDHGTVDLREGHLCRSPTFNTREKANIFHGVEKDPATRRRINYWMLHDPIDPYKQATIKKADLTPVAAYDEDGERNVFHIRFTKRTHQTRGLTAIAPIFDVAGYHTDCEFLKMVQQRSASFFAFVENRASTFDPAYLAAEMRLGVDQTRDKGQEYEQHARQFMEASPGGWIKSLPGSEIKGFSSNVPNPEWFQHVKLLLTLMGVNLGMPLVLVLMDASETNFSGWRGAFEQAKMGFRKNQRRLVTRLHRPYMRFKLLKRGEFDKSFQRLINKSGKPGANGKKFDVFRHGWTAPAWPYVNPTEDATSDLIRESNMQISPRRRAQERGVTFKAICDETRQDRGYAIRRAAKFAAKLNKNLGLEGPDVVRWRDLAPLPTPEGVQIALSTRTMPGGDDRQPSEPPKGRDDA
jgi:capsid protein